MSCLRFIENMFLIGMFLLETLQIFGIWSRMKVIFYYIKNKIINIAGNESRLHEFNEQDVLLDVLSESYEEFEVDFLFIIQNSDVETEADYTSFSNTLPGCTAKLCYEIMMITYKMKIIENLLAEEGMRVEEEIMEDIEQIEEDDCISIFSFSTDSESTNNDFNSSNIIFFEAIDFEEENWYI